MLGRHLNGFRKIFPLKVIFFLSFFVAMFPHGSASQDFQWSPPDIDRTKPATIDGVACNIGEVLPAASQRVQQFALNMQQFSASEELEFEVADPNGKLRSAQKAKFTYVAYIHEDSPESVVVDEFRNNSVAETQFPSKLATLGTAAMALIFHPNNLKNFSSSCEGQTDWHGRRAWLVHLTQTTPSDFRGYRVANRYYRVMLKVRAWVDAETFEVLRLETNLLNPIDEIPLKLEAIIVDYGPVTFSNAKIQLWLPQVSDIYMDYKSRLYHHRHTFSDFQLFMVDTTQKVTMRK